MINKQVLPYEPNAAKKEQVEKMFDNVAWRYDFLNRLMSFGIDTLWRRHLIKQMKSYNPNSILDMATGTGDLAIMTAKSMRSVNITGIDLSNNMITLAKKKLEKTGFGSRIKMLVGDSENIDFPNDSFDSAMIAFGIRNFENLDKGLSELLRVLKPGCPIFILEFSKPTIFPVKQLFNLYFKYAVPLIGKVFSKDQRAYSYLYESVQAFPDYDSLKEIMQTVGYKNCKWEALSIGICSLYIGEKQL